MLPGWAGPAPKRRRATPSLSPVDSVSDIVTIADDALQPPPVAAGDAVVGYLEGLAPCEDRMIMVLDLRSLTADEAELQAA